MNERKGNLMSVESNLQVGMFTQIVVNQAAKVLVILFIAISVYGSTANGVPFMKALLTLLGAKEPWLVFAPLSLIIGAISSWSIRDATTKMKVDDKGSLVSKITLALSKMGYRKESDDEGVAVFKPTTIANKFTFLGIPTGGGITITFDNDMSVIAGPMKFLKSLDKKV
jgi:hypothetical protein